MATHLRYAVQGAVNEMNQQSSLRVMRGLVPRISLRRAKPRLYDRDGWDIRSFTPVFRRAMPGHNRQNDASAIE